MESRAKDLDRWELQLLAEIDSLSRAIEPLITRRQELSAKLELVRKLKGLETPTAVEPHGPPSDGVRFNVLQDAVHKTLVEHGKPMHLSELREALAARGVTIPGRGTDANLIVHLRRAPDVFDRKARGTYGLTAWKKQKPSR